VIVGSWALAEMGKILRVPVGIVSPPLLVTLKGNDRVVMLVAAGISENEEEEIFL